MSVQTQKQPGTMTKLVLNRETVRQLSAGGGPIIPANHTKAYCTYFACHTDYTCHCTKKPGGC